MSDDKKTTELEPRLIRRLQWMAQLARLSLLLERLWPRLWPLLILTSLFAASVMFDLLPMLGTHVHMLVLGVFTLSFLIMLAKVFHEMDWPNFRDGVHRLEQQSGLDHQPLQALLDKPAGPSQNKLAQAIWISHQDRMVKAMDQVTLRWPRSYLYKRDPYSLRAGLIILLVLGAIESRFDLPDRLSRAFTPEEQTVARNDWAIQAWITPPEHTYWGAIYLNSQNPVSSDPIDIPQHSHILVRLEGRPTNDIMTLKTGPFEERFQSLGRGTFNLESVIDQGNSLSIRRDGQTVFNWPINIMPDDAPTISLRSKPRGSMRGHLSVAFEAEDDYGLKEAALVIRHPGDTSHPEIVLKQAVQGQETRSSFRDNLAAHPWAGQKVLATPRITDNADQNAFGSSILFELPERRFTHTFAKKLVAIRKSLYAPDAQILLQSKIQLGAILQKPDQIDHEVAVYLGLKVAQHRLQIDVSPKEIAEIQTILWESAVHLEEGASGTMRDRLEDMSRQMQDLMQGDKDKAAMEALFEQMQQSLKQFMQQMAKVQNPFEGMEEFFTEDNPQMIGQEEMADMLERAREMMRAGDIEGAQAMMEQFRDIMMRLAMQATPDQDIAKQAQETLQRLKSIRKDQESLLDRTFKRTRNSEKSDLKAAQEGLKEAEEQNRLLQELEKVFATYRKMGLRRPKSLMQAESDMQNSADFLKRGLDENAIQAETRALDALLQALSDSAQAMAQKMGMQPQLGNLPGFDPLGRGGNGRLEGSEGEVIPTEAETHRAREIMQELYRRAGEKSRPDLELKYIERLLDRF